VPGAQGPARPVLFVWYAAWCAARLSLIVFLHNYMFARPLLDFGGGFDIIEETKPNQMLRSTCHACHFACFRY
jgi:hypothetical protein